jgi:hypothetical protein
MPTRSKYMERKERFQAHQMSQGRKRWETYVTQDEINKIKVLLAELRCKQN